MSHPRTISHAIVALEHSGRGISVLADLSRLLDGPISGLDQYGQAAVLDLLTCAFGGMGMTTRDAIKESLERCGVRP